MNDPFEDELRWALQRREPTKGFVDGVMARIPALPTRPSIARSIVDWLSGARWAPALVAALVIVMAAGTWQYRRFEQRREAERCKQELIFALQLTSTKLEQAKTKLLHSTGGAM